MAIKTYRAFQHYCTNCMSISQIVVMLINIQCVYLILKCPVYIYICIYIQGVLKLDVHFEYLMALKLFKILACNLCSNVDKLCKFL